MFVKKKSLLALLHIINYAKAFNEFNAKLDASQKNHFGLAGKNIEDLRDPFVLYSQADSVTAELLELTGLQHINDSVKELNAKAPSLNDEISVNTKWFAQIASEAITFYDERTLFFMTCGEYRTDLIRALGKLGYESFHEDMLELLDHMISGNADQSIREVKSDLEEAGSPYARPPAPYREKEQARYSKFLRTCGLDK
jgi:hypothetical protein